MTFWKSSNYFLQIFAPYKPYFMTQITLYLLCTLSGAQFYWPSFIFLLLCMFAQVIRVLAFAVFIASNSPWPCLPNYILVDDSLFLNFFIPSSLGDIVQNSTRNHLFTYPQSMWYRWCCTPLHSRSTCP